MTFVRNRSDTIGLWSILIELKELSKVGLGMYRMGLSTKDNNHYDALALAVSEGCNLIDTSSNYTNGLSEQLIGKFLSESQMSDQVFIISKAGYVNKSDDAMFARLSKKISFSDAVKIDEATLHSISPDFLVHQLDQSLTRMNRKYLDCYLIHNPEYHLIYAEKADKEKLYRQIKKAFAFLEDQVKTGKIRYYGISSNTLPLDNSDPTSLEFSRLIEIAKEVGENHHFKFIQFPFNIVEDQAKRVNNGSMSLLQQARKNAVVTLANRPLNARKDGQVIRLATYESQIDNLEFDKDKLLFDECVEILNDKLEEDRADIRAMDLEIMQFLSQNWMNLDSQTAVNNITTNHLFPLLEQIYGGNINVVESADLISEAHKYKFIDLTRLMARYVYKNITNISLQYKQALQRSGRIDAVDNRPLPSILCEKYLEDGIDHVLVGMRKQKYVAELKDLFKAPISLTT